MANQHKEHYFQAGRASCELVLVSLFAISPRSPTQSHGDQYAQFSGLMGGQSDEWPTTLTGDSLEEYRLLLML
jgi:hypothetical protein